MKGSTSLLESSLLEKAKMITQLIIDDMTHYKLSNESARKGLDTSVYQIKISDAIFTLSLIPKRSQTEELRDWYNGQTERVLEVDICDSKELHKIAKDILLGLMNWKDSGTLPSLNPESL